MKVHDTIIELRGRVISQGVAIEGVRAKIILPASPFGRARMRLFPSSDQEMRQLMQSFKAAFEGERPNTLGGKGKELVVCRELNMLTSSTRFVSPDIQRSEIKCEPVGIWHSVSPDESRLTGASSVVFRLTPNRHLGVVGTDVQRFDGSCEVTKFRQVTIELVPGTTLVFDKHFKWATDKRDGTSTRLGFPVAVGEFAGNFHDPSQVAGSLLPKLDDLLILASFGASHRCMCVGWQVSDVGGRISRFDRGGIGRPSRRPSPVLDSGLVPLAYFQQYLSHAWTVFQASPYADAIRSAVYAVVPARTTTVESRFLSMFAALEELVLTFRRQSDREFVLPPAQWSNVESAIKGTIRAQLADSDKCVRSMLYDNLGGVNRVPLRRVLEQFVADLHVDLSDLWPLFPGDRSGLGAIRNKLVHGDLESAASVGSLGTATQHLRWTVERIVLALLKWPVERSEVRPSFLAGCATDMRRLPEARAELGRVLTRQA